VSQSTDALVLSGGGVYAAYEVGVIRALAEGCSPVTEGSPFDPAIITGTSSGAFNASYLAAFGDKDFASCARDLEHLWLNTLTSDCGNRVYRYRAFPTACGLSADGFRRTAARFATDTVFIGTNIARNVAASLQGDDSMPGKIMQVFDLTTVFDFGPFDKLVSETIAVEKIPFSQRTLRVIVTNWDVGEAQEFGNEDFAEDGSFRIITASAAIPGLLPPVYVNGIAYVDGGILMNTPLSPAIHAGARTMHVIYMDPDLSTMSTARFSNTLSAVDRLNLIRTAAIANADIEAAARLNHSLAEQGADRDSVASEFRPLTIHRYRMRQDLGGTLGSLRFERDFVRALLQLGYEHALEHDCELEECILPASS
jgi:predicted acylesterase/phospholipase RssA